MILKDEITEEEVSKLGIDVESIDVVDTLEELSKNPPNMVIAECIKNINFTQDNGKLQSFKRGNSYVMALGIYGMLRYDKQKKIFYVKPKANITFSSAYRKYSGQDLTNKTLLVCRTGGIGDLLFIQPNLLYLKEKYPSCKIKFICNPQYQPMVKNWSCVDEVYNLPFNYIHLLNSDYHAFFEGVIERTREAENTNAYKLFSKWMGLNLSDDKLLPKQEPKENVLRECEKILEGKGIEKNNFILLQATSTSKLRTPNFKKYFIPLIKKLSDDGHKIIIIDSPKKYDQVNKLINLFDAETRKNLFNFSKYSYSLDYGICYAYLSELIIGPDSSFTHIGISLNKKVFGIYGPFPGEIRLSLYKNCDWINSKCYCSPCFAHKDNLCIEYLEGPLCLKSIDVEESYQKIVNLLSKKED